MLRVTRALLVLLVGLCSMGAMASERVQLPDWVKEAAARPQKHYPARTNAVVLLKEESITVSKPGEYVENVRRVVRILRPEGKNEASISIALSSNSKLLNAHVWCASPDDHNYEVKQKDFIARSRFDKMTLYDDEVFETATAPGGNPGAVVAFEYSVRRIAWEDYASWRPQEDIPVEQASFTLMTPAGWSYKTSWINSASVVPVSTNGAGTRWELREIEPILVEEKHRPDFQALQVRMEVAYAPPDLPAPVFSSWESIGKWSGTLSQPRRQSTAEISAKVSQLTAGASGFDDVVARLASFMQSEIRYVAIEIGIGGFQPHAAGEVFRKRYGDCKDKATLLGTMLQEAGIRSRDVLIYDEHGVTQKGNPGNFFDHMVLAIEMPASSTAQYRSVVQSKTGQRYLIFDPTNEWVPLGELPEYEQGNFALMTGSDGGELIQLPVFEPERNLMATSGKFTISADGQLNGELKVTYKGSHAWRARARLSSQSELERKKHAESYLGSSLQGAVLKEVRFDNLDERSKEFMAHYAFTAPGFLKTSGTLIFLRPSILNKSNIRLDWKTRKYPVALSSTSDETETFEFVLPSDVEVDELPKGVEIDEGFASFKSTFSVSDGVLRYQRHYVVRELQVSLDKLEQLRKLEETIMRDESSTVILKKKS